MFEDADRDPSLLDRGALNFVVVGGGPTGVETAGALADMINQTMTRRVPRPRGHESRVHIVDLGHTLLAPFSERAHDYVAKVLRRKGVELHLEAKVTEVAPGRVTLADGTTIETRCVVWGGGIKAPPVAAAAGLPQGRRRANRRPARPHGRRASRASMRWATSPTSGTRREIPSTARLRCPAERRLGCQEPARGLRRRANGSRSNTGTRASWR